MRILILGCDTAAARLAVDLANDGHNITVMDMNSDRLLALAQGSRVEAALSSESIMEDLRSVGIDNVDVFLALSEDDNQNGMAAQIAGHIFHVPDVICRIGDPHRQRFYEALGINVVSPTTVIVNATKTLLKATHEDRE